MWTLPLRQLGKDSAKNTKVFYKKTLEFLLKFKVFKKNSKVFFATYRKQTPLSVKHAKPPIGTNKLTI